VGQEGGEGDGGKEGDEGEGERGDDEKADYKPNPLKRMWEEKI